MFQELASTPATMQASKAADLYGSFEGHIVEQADAKQAYTQAKLKGVPTWVRLPKEKWPQEWIDAGYKDPVVPLRLALYGHPQSGAFWEQHCEAHLQKIGFTKIQDWKSCFWHPELKVFLIVCFDDFNLSGPKKNLPMAWQKIRKHIATGEPEPLRHFLGCTYENVWVTPSWTGGRCAGPWYVKEYGGSLYEMRRNLQTLGGAGLQNEESTDTLPTGIARSIVCP